MQRQYSGKVTTISTLWNRRPARLVRIVIGMIVAMLATGVLQAQAAEKPVIGSVRVEQFFDPIRPGDRVTITIQATHPDGISELSGFLGNLDEGLSSFRPTGEPDEFQATLIVPSTQPNGEPLPRGSYTLEMRKLTNAQGGGVYHKYRKLTTFDFDPAPGEPWGGRIAARYVPGPPRIEVDLELSAREPGARKIAYAVWVTNYFLQTVGEVQEGVVTLPGAGAVVHQPLVIAIPGDGDQYRLKVRLKEVGSEREQEFVRCLLTDVTDGYRRELRLRNLEWQHLPVKANSAPPPIPESGEWKPGGGFGGRQWSEHFAEDTAAVWFRTEFEVPQSLAAEHYELYFSGLRFGGRIFLNGKYLGQYIDPFYPFSVDATSAILPGQVNSLAIFLWDYRAIETPRNNGWTKRATRALASTCGPIGMGAIRGWG